MKKFIGFIVILICLYLLDKENHNEGEQQQITPKYDQYETDCINKQNDLDSSHSVKLKP